MHHTCKRFETRCSGRSIHSVVVHSQRPQQRYCGRRCPSHLGTVVHSQQAPPRTTHLSAAPHAGRTTPTCASSRLRRPGCHTSTSAPRSASTAATQMSPSARTTHPVFAAGTSLTQTSSWMGQPSRCDCLTGTSLDPAGGVAVVWMAGRACFDCSRSSEITQPLHERACAAAPELRTGCARSQQVHCKWHHHSGSLQTLSQAHAEPAVCCCSGLLHHTGVWSSLQRSSVAAALRKYAAATRAAALLPPAARLHAPVTLHSLRLRCRACSSGCEAASRTRRTCRIRPARS